MMHSCKFKATQEAGTITVTIVQLMRVILIMILSYFPYLTTRTGFDIDEITLYIHNRHVCVLQSHVYTDMYFTILVP